MNQTMLTTTLFQNIPIRNLKKLLTLAQRRETIDSQMAILAGESCATPPQVKNGGVR